MHSDAGFKTDDALVGSLGIYTTNFNDGKVNCGISRYASRDLTDMVLTGLQKDISSRFGIQWARRSMWNRNYSETRLPAVPSMILETLSHQNFADLKLGYEPEFKFTVARSVYKSILKYLAEMHHSNYTVQPLPVSHFAVTEGKKKIHSNCAGFQQKTRWNQQQKLRDMWFIRVSDMVDSTTEHT